MKPFEELTRDELANLTEEQIKKYMLLAKAEAGVKIIEQPTPPPGVSVVASDVYFETSQFGIKSRDRALIQEIADFINARVDRLVKTDYDWRRGYEYTSLEPFGTVLGVDPKRAFTPSELSLVDEQLASLKGRKDAYEKRKKEYEAERAKSDEIQNEIWSKVNEATAEWHRVSEMKRRFQEYLELAEGDREKAIRFFEKANYLMPEEKDEVYGHGWNMCAEEARELTN